MITRCLQSNKRFGICASKSNIGVTLEITQYQPTLDGRCYITTKALNRFEILEQSEIDGYTIAKVRYFNDDELNPIDNALAHSPSSRLQAHSNSNSNSNDEETTQQLVDSIRRSIERILANPETAGFDPNMKQLIFETTENLPQNLDAESFSFWLAVRICRTVECSREILETRDTRKRLRLLNELMLHGDPHMPQRNPLVVRAIVLCFLLFFLWVADRDFF
jgi:hypothetical protein